MSCAVTGRRNAWRARVFTICLAQAVSCAASPAGWQTKILWRLGDSVAPVALNGPENLDLADVREELETRQSAGFDGAAQEVLVQIAARAPTGSRGT